LGNNSNRLQLIVLDGIVLSIVLLFLRYFLQFRQDIKNLLRCEALERVDAFGGRGKGV